MAIRFPVIARGLRIPDSSFSHSWGESWAKGSGLIQPWHESDHSGTGRHLVVRVDGTSFGSHDDIISGFTPRGVGCGPYFADTPSWMGIWFGIVIKTENIAEDNADTLIHGQLWSYDADGDAIGPHSVAMTPTDSDGYPPTYAADYKLYSTTVAYIPNAATRYYRLKLNHNDEDVGGTLNLIHYQWVGIGFTNNVPASGLDTPSEDQIISPYSPTPSTGTRVRTKHHSPQGSVQPLITSAGVPVHAAQLSMAFPEITEEDIATIRSAYYWNRPSNTGDVAMRAGVPVNRGSPEPVIVALDRGVVKRAFYANIAADIMFNHQRDVWSETGSFWNTPLTFAEWIT